MSPWWKHSLQGLLLLSAPISGAGAVGPEPRVDIIQDDAYFYGQSPPVYPSPPTKGTGPWADAYAKASALVSKMTLEERANITIGYPPTNACGAVTGSVPRLNWTGICHSGAGNGLKGAEFVSGWASAISVGAAWNRKLAHERGLFMGAEFRGKGSHTMGGPVMGPLGRVPEGGRNWEGFSNDPYLAGQLSAEHIEGAQSSGIIAMSKHYIGNEQETRRWRVPGSSDHAVSANIDDRTMHEVYLWPFADAVRAGTAAIMCSLNRVNNSYACQNSYTQNGLLKTELGFQGFVVTDWYGMSSGLAAAEAGLDLAFPAPQYFGPGGSALVEAVRNGSLAESRLTDMATRIVGAWYHLKHDINPLEPGEGLPLDFTKPHPVIFARKPESKKVVLQGAIEGHVLVKNVNNALPLRKPRLLSVFGYDAPSPRAMNVPDPRVPGPSAWKLGAMSFNATVASLAISGRYGRVDQIALGGTIIGGGGSGVISPAYISAPFDAISERAYVDDTSLFWDFESVKPAVNAISDACLVFINAYATEGGDRQGIYDDYSDGLIKNVADQCANTIVVIHNAGVRLVDQWADHPNVTAIIFAHLPGQDSGRALVKLLYGEVSPSGKLPYTVARNESHYRPLAPSEAEGRFAVFPQSDFSEGLYIDYKQFDADGREPRYEFGFGLSYTTFGYSDLRVRRAGRKAPERLPADLPVVPGGNPALWEVVAHVRARVTNTGSVKGAEVAQLYVGIPGADTPVRQLRGFEKRELRPGESRSFSFELTRKDLSTWDVAEQNWVLREGEYRFYVGASSRILPLNTTLALLD